MFVISCHADTNFRFHCLERKRDGVALGRLDNFAGVHAVMKAYFSGRVRGDQTRIELTYGEETDFAGARRVLRTLRRGDLVAVVDVTGTPTRKDFVIEKCRSLRVRRFLLATLRGMEFDIYRGCPDPVADSDETDIYARKCPYAFFLGVPVWGGDYNAENVKVREASLDAIAEALCRLSETWPRYASKERLPA